MASGHREPSETGFYHVIQRGVNLMDIFEDDDDRARFLEIFEKAMRTLGVEVHAWCLMSNHTHLLLRTDRLETLSAAMRRLGSSYARYFNRRHRRSGHLFEGRFHSCCVDSDKQFIMVTRYIHRNPMGNEKGALSGHYEWSSYREYVSGVPGVCKTEFAVSLFGGIQELERLHKADLPGDRQHDIDYYGRLTDEQARSAADEVLVEAGFGVCTSKIGTLAKELRDKALAAVKAAVGCSLRQLQRLTAVPYSAIRAAVGAESCPPERDELPVSPAAELVASLDWSAHLREAGGDTLLGQASLPLPGLRATPRLRAATAN